MVIGPSQWDLQDFGRMVEYGPLKSLMFTPLLFKSLL
jgi:hypothetical protein